MDNIAGGKVRSDFYFISSILYFIGAAVPIALLGVKANRARFLAGMAAFLFKPIALTCAGKTDGGGAQVQAVMSVQAFCKAFGYKYVHTPFYQMEHTSGLAEIVRWERLFNLGSGVAPASEAGHPVVPFAAYVKSPRLWFRETIVAVEHLHDFTDRCPAAYLAIQDALRRKFAGSPVPKPDKCLTIAVHIRRGDVTATAQSRRFTDGNVIALRLSKYHRACDEAGCSHRTVICSQGRPDDFPELAALGCEFRLNDDPLDSLNQLVQADILLMAKSSYSYVAGILSTGVVVYEPFWHSPLPNWVDAANDDAFGRSLSLHIEKIGGRRAEARY